MNRTLGRRTRTDRPRRTRAAARAAAEGPAPRPVRRLVELKLFAGLSSEELAETLGISTATVEREWVIARAWLYQRLAGSIA